MDRNEKNGFPKNFEYLNSKNYKKLRELISESIFNSYNLMIYITNYAYENRYNIQKIDKLYTSLKYTNFINIFNSEKCRLN